MFNTRYIEIDSTYRNRTCYSNPAVFDILMSKGGANSKENAVDPVSLGVSFFGTFTGTTIVTGPPSSVTIIGGSTINHIYNNCYVYNETRKEGNLIVSYDGGTTIATLQDTIPGTWLDGDTYLLRKELPSFSGTILALPAPTSTEVQLSGGPTFSGALVGDFIKIVNSDQTHKILGYTDSGVVTVAHFDPVPTALDDFEILQFSYDNEVPLVYRDGLFQNQTMCYEMELLNVILPNVDLNTGGTITRYPFVYVELQNVSGSSAGTKNIIYSNNPNSSRMLFRAPIDDISTAPFIKIDGDSMIQTIRFKMNDNLKFGVYLPDGTPFQTFETDNVSPQKPNKNLQICALFSIKKVSCC